MKRAILIVLVLAATVLLLTIDRDRLRRPEKVPADPAVATPAEPVPDESPNAAEAENPVDRVLRGTVSDPDGAPLDGAVVEIRNGKFVRAAGGIYRIEGLSPGRLEVLVAAPGYLPVARDFTMPETGEVVLDFRLGPGGLSIGGRVLDLSGDPIEGARIRIIHRDPQWHFLWRLEHPPTGPDGSFRIEGIPAGMLRIDAKARFYKWEVQHAPAGGTDLVFKLSGAGEIAGRFVPPGGADPQKPRVQIQYTGETESGPVSDWFCSDEFEEQIDGLTFRLTGLLPGVYRVKGRVLDVGHAETREIQVEAGKVTTVEIPLAEGGVLTGLVLAQDGKPIAGAYVVTSDEENLPAEHLLEEGSALLNEGADARTDEKGRYRIVGLAKGIFEIAVRADGYRVGKAKALPVPETKEVPTIRLEAGSAVTITAPEASGGFVFIGTEDGSSRDSKIDAQGRCRIDSIPPGIHSLQLSGRSWSLRFEITVELGKTLKLTIHRPRGHAELSGRITRAGEGQLSRRLLLNMALPDGVRVTFRASSDGDGNYRFAVLPEGEAEIVVGRENGRFAASSPRKPVRLRAGENLLDLDLPATVIKLRIVDGETGKGVRARLIREGRVIDWSESDGRVAIPELESGEHRLIIDAKGYAPQRITARATDNPEEQRVVLDKATVVEIAVRDEAGEPLPSAGISIVDATGWDLAGHALKWRFSDDRTGKRLFHLGRGTYGLTVKEEGFKVHQGEITAPVPGGRLDVMLRAE